MVLALPAIETVAGGQFEAALRCYQSVVRLQPQHWKAVLNIAVAQRGAWIEYDHVGRAPDAAITEMAPWYVGCSISTRSPGRT